MMLCVCVCLSVCLSVRHVRGSCQTRIFKNFSPSDSHTILVFRTKRYGNIPMRTQLGRRMHHDLRLISRFISELMQDRAIVTIERE